MLEKVMAYPFYVETSVLLYNRYYADEAPATIDAVLDYSENYEASEVTAKVENMFEWNVADVIENYMFLGGYTILAEMTEMTRVRYPWILIKLWNA